MTIQFDVRDLDRTSNSGWDSLHLDFRFSFSQGLCCQPDQTVKIVELGPKKYLIVFFEGEDASSTSQQAHDFFAVQLQMSFAAHLSDDITHCSQEFRRISTSLMDHRHKVSATALIIDDEELDIVSLGSKNTWLIRSGGSSADVTDDENESAEDTAVRAKAVLAPTLRILTVSQPALQNFTLVKMKQLVAHAPFDEIADEILSLNSLERNRGTNTAIVGEISLGRDSAVLVDPQITLQQALPVIRKFLSNTAPGASVTHRMIQDRTGLTDQRCTEALAFLAKSGGLLAKLGLDQKITYSIPL